MKVWNIPALFCLITVISLQSVAAEEWKSASMEVCPRKPHLIGSRHCRKECVDDSECRGRKKKCVCDDVCGMACLNPRGKCPQPKIFNGRVTVDGRSQLGAIAKYSCDQGYEIQGPDTRICNGEREWSGIDPRCHPVSTEQLLNDRGTLEEERQHQNIESGQDDPNQALCSEPPNVKNADHDGPKQTRFLPTSEITYTCRSGFYADGIDFAKCKTDGEWAGPMMTCQEIFCVDLGELDNGVRFGEGPYAVDYRVNYECDKSYRLVGSPTLTCKKDGTWDRSKPVCQRTASDSCPRLRAPRNGDKIGRMYTLGSIITILCNPGYEVRGTSKRRCLDDGTWSGTEANCEPIDCGHPGQLYNGYIDGTRFTYGSVIKYRCVDGAKFDGLTYTATCRANGQWSFPLPRCLRSCTLPSINEAQVFVGSELAGLVHEHGTRLNVVCNEGLSPADLSTPPICNNGTWIGLSRCVQGGCEERPREISNGIALYRSTKYGDRVRYRCNTGHKLIGDQYLICESGEWKGQLPTCEPVYCPHPGQLDNGRILLVGDIGKFEYRAYVRHAGHGEKIEYYCSSGYRLDGPSAATCIDGFWSPERKPQCIDNQHPILPDSSELFSTS